MPTKTSRKKAGPLITSSAVPEPKPSKTRKPRATHQIIARCSEDVFNMAEELAEYRGETFSVVLRDLVRSAHRDLKAGTFGSSSEAVAPK